MGNRAEGQPDDPWADLRWDDLEQWAGSTILGRGRNYQRGGQVVALARTSDGTLLGRVSGTELYMTRVTHERADPIRQLSSRCSCPYGINCKHAVAVVLEYLERLKSGEDIPEELPDALVADESEEADDWEWDEDDSSAVGDAQLTSEYLDGLSKAELTDLVMALAGASEEATRLLRTRARSSQGDAGALVRGVRAELTRVTAEPGWQNHWAGEGYTPNYGYVRVHLESLLAAGEADSVLELGQEVLEEGIHHVEQSDDEGETATEVAECLEPVWQAAGQSSLDPAQRILWLVDRLLKDEYELCFGADESDVWDADAATWSQVADALLARLNEGEAAPRPGGDDFHTRYRRDRVVRWAVRALDSADRPDDALALCLREAPITQSYERAVKRLIGAGQLDEARRLAREGIAKTMRDLLTSLGRRDEWETYLASLQEAHRRKRTFLAALERLSERRIVDG